MHNDAVASSPTISQRGRVGYLTRKHGEDHPAVVEARAELAVAVTSAAIRKHLSKAPPLSERQKAQLRALISTITPINSAAGQESA